jgi:hypothetical protein
MRWIILVTLFLVGCPTQQQIKDEKQFRKEHRECLHDRIDLIDKIEVMKKPPVPECQKPLIDLKDVKLGKPAKECLLILEHFGPGSFSDREQAFRTCWDRVDNSHIDALYECRRERDRCDTQLENCKYDLGKKKEYVFNNETSKEEAP